jgi:Peptidase S24-like
MPEVTQSSDKQKRSLAIEVLRNGGSIRLRAWGTSMLPVIWPGDILKIENLTGALEIGDVVLVERGERLFVHRLVHADKDRWTMRGDALRKSDPAVSRSQILGKVTTICAPDTHAARSGTLSGLKRLVGLMLGQFGFVRNFALRLYTRKRVAKLGIDWPAGDLTV